MPDRSRKRPRDLNQLAKSLVDDTTDPLSRDEPADDRDPLAVELGRRGGLKVGKARAEKMTAEERRASAQRAARAQWERPKR